MNHAPLNQSSLNQGLSALPGSAAVLRHLQSPGAFAAYAGAEAPLETIETHMSWVFLIGEHVLKLKKPVRFPSLDFSTIEAREAFCREEVRLNSRLAPGIYRGLMAVQWKAGRLAVVPEATASKDGVIVDWLVWMRRLPGTQMLDWRIAESFVLPTEIDELVAVLASFYRSATRIELDAAEHLARFQREQAVSREVLLRPQFQLEGASLALDSLDQALLRSRDRLQARISQGRIVDGHGDLRPEHVCLLQPPVVIDCLEFSSQLRQVDPFEELSFLALECDMAGAPWIGARILQGCATALGDTPPPALQHLYTAYRAVVRARLAIAHLLDPCPRTPQKWTPLAQRYITHALLALEAFEQHDSFSAATPDGSP